MADNFILLFFKMVGQMNRLTPREIKVIIGTSKGEPIIRLGKNANNIFSKAVRKLRFASYSNFLECRLGECNYSRLWFKANPVSTKELIERHQLACEKALESFIRIKTDGK